MRHQLRWVVAAVLVLGTWTLSTGAATARTVTRLGAHVTPATAYVGTAVTITGTVTPRATVTLERLAGTRWRVVAHQHPTKAGGYAFTTRVPRTAGKSRFRVVSGKVVSHTLNVLGTKAIYHVTFTAAAELDAGRPLTFAGRVSPKATGSVFVQHLVGRSWVTVAKAKLQASAFTAALTLPQGSHRLRVVKPFSARVAGGLAPAATVAVLAAPAITTTTLPRASVGHAYSATFTGAGGKAPYTWALAGSATPAGLSLSPAGLLTGTPNLSGDQRLGLVLTDALGGQATVDVTLTITPRYGPVESWGHNLDGALGDGTSVDRSAPTDVPGISTATSVVGAGDDGYALLADGTVWAWGDNGFGQLGVADSLISRATAAQVPGLDDVTAIAASEWTGYALRRDGTVWAWGGDFYGNLGDGKTTNRPQPAPVPGLSGVVQVAAIAGNGYFLTGDGTVWALGRSGGGGLGNGSYDPTSVPVRVTLPPIRTITSGTGSTALAIDRNGLLWAWGNNGEGELGTASTAGLSNLPGQVPGLSDVVGAAGSMTDAYALTRGGVVFAWGTNYSGQLGHGGSAAGSSTPTAVDGLSAAVGISAGSQVAYALLSDGTVAAWGTNTNGQLGGGGALGSASSAPALVVGLTGVTRISSAEGAVFALRAQ